MVLAELGGQLRESLRQWQSSGPSASGRRPVRAELEALLAQVARALIEADVQVALVLHLRENIRQQVTPVVEQLQEQLDQQQQETTASSSSSSNNNLAAASSDPSLPTTGSSARARQIQRLQAQLSKAVQRALADQLVQLLSPTTPSSKKSSAAGPAPAVHKIQRGQPNVLLMVGLQGAGKTTTVAKVARYYQRQGYKTCMVCADTFRAGALDQLKQNATKLRIPFYGSYTQADPVLIAQQGVQQFQKDHYEIILVDTSGRHQQEESLWEEMQEIASAVHPQAILLVLDATQGQAVFDQAQAFARAVPVGGVILTKLDGHAKGGGALSAVAATHSPILFVGSGEHFDDLEPFQAPSFVAQLLGQSDVRGFLEALKNSNTGGHGGEEGPSQEQLLEKVSKGEFTLRDMYHQFQRVMNMGPLNKVMGMMPGLPEGLLSSGSQGGADQTERLRQFMVMMDSMTNAELDGQVEFQVPPMGTVTALPPPTRFTSALPYIKDPATLARIRRIAAGSGCHPKQVEMLLLAHEQCSGVVHKMSKAGLVGGKGSNLAKQQAQMAAQLRKNPNLIQQRLNQMDPHLLQQMGGRDQVLAMMQQMAKGGGAGGGGGGGSPWEALSRMPASMHPPGMTMPGAAGGGAPPGGLDMDSLMKMAQAMGMGGPPPPRR